MLKKIKILLILFSATILFDASSCMAMENNSQNNNSFANNEIIWLHEACKNGNLDLVKKIVENLIAIGKKYILNEANEEGFTPFHIACKNGHLEVIKFLLENGAEKNLKMAYMFGDYTPIALACQNGHLKVVEFLFSKDFDQENLNITTAYGFTPFYFACQSGNLDLVKFLFNNGGAKSLNNIDHKGYTPLHVACQNNHLEIVRFLLKNGAEESLNKPDLLKRHMPIHIACQKGKINIAITLIMHGAKFFEQDSNGKTPAEIATENNYRELIPNIKKYFLNILMTYLKNKQHKEFINLFEKNPQFYRFKGLLSIVCEWNNLEIAKYLIENNHANVNEQDNKKITPIHLACRHASLELVKYLIGKGANIYNKEISLGKSAIHEACYNKNSEIIKYLINESNANINELDNISSKPILHACINGNTDVFLLLLSKGAKIDEKNKLGEIAIHTACFSGNLNIVKYIVENLKQNVNTPANKNIKPIHYACMSRNVQLLDYLIEKGANIIDETNDNELILPIHFACKTNSLNVIFDLFHFHNATIEQINRRITFSKDLFKHNKLLRLLLTKITDENGIVHLNKLIDKNGDTLATYLIRNPILISIILSNNACLYSTNIINNENGLLKLINSEFNVTEDIIVKFIKIIMETNESIKILIKKKCDIIPTEIAENPQTFTNFSNNLVNTSIVFNLLSGTHAVEEEKTINGIKKAKTVSDRPLNDDIATEIMSYGYECFENPNNRAIIAALKEKNEQPKEKEPKNTESKEKEEKAE